MFLILLIQSVVNCNRYGTDLQDLLMIDNYMIGVKPAMDITTIQIFTLCRNDSSRDIIHHCLTNWVNDIILSRYIDLTKIVILVSIS